MQPTFKAIKRIYHLSRKFKLKFIEMKRLSLRSRSNRSSAVNADSQKIAYS